MKRFTQTVITCLAAFVMIFASGCTTSPTAPKTAAHTVPVGIKFITPALNEFSGPNELELIFTNASGEVFPRTLTSPKMTVIHEKVISTFEQKVDLPVEIDGKALYRLKANFRGFPNDSTLDSPSRDVSYLVALNGSAPAIGTDDGVYFSVNCAGEISVPDASWLQENPHGTRMYIDIFNENFWLPAGVKVTVSVDEPAIGSGNQPIWKPMLISSDFYSGGMVLTSQFEKIIDPSGTFRATVFLRLASSDQTIRVKVAYEYQGTSQVITNSVSVTTFSYIWSPGVATADGYKIYHIPATSSGKG